MLVASVQFLYPTDRALPFSRLHGDFVGLSDGKAITQTALSSYAKTPLTVKTPGHTTKTTLAEAGVDVDVAQLQHDLSYYPWWQRLVPGSLLLMGMVKNAEPHLTIDKARFAEFAKDRATECYVAPKNAGVKVVEGKVVLDPSKPGRICETKKLSQDITKKIAVKEGLQVTAPLTVTQPTRSNDSVTNIIKAAQTIVDRKLSVSVAGNMYDVAPAELASWLVFPEDPSSKKLAVDIDGEVVKKYLARAQKDIYIAPGSTKITTVDGVETAREEGPSGRGIDMAKTTESIRAHIVSAKQGPAVATIATLAPLLVYDRSYTPTAAGLQALVDDLAKQHGDFAISVRKLGDDGVSSNGTKQYHPASTYKMYAAWAALKRIEAGQMSWDEPALAGKTVGQCFDVMIINSDNACGEWFGTKIGWTNLNNMLKGIGLTCTNLSTAWLSCSNDEALFLQKLERGELLSEASKARLIDVMKRQIYRAGIPKGVGVPVADKVGFIDGYLHDAAIVYAPQGTYVMTIMSKGSSWATIADVAGKVHAQLNSIK